MHNQKSVSLADLLLSIVLSVLIVGVYAALYFYNKTSGIIDDLATRLYGLIF